jgi:FAD-dependent urate hydroxylase
MTKRQVLVIGCGVGGPVVALALQRAGFAPTLYEAHAEASADEVGSFLNLASNGLDVLRTLGALEVVQGAGFPTPRMTLFSGTGKRLGEVPNGGRLPDGTVSLTLKRGVLHRLLREEAQRRGIGVVSGKRLVDATSNDDHVVASFDDGSRATGELLVGADGLQSRTRAVIDAANPGPRFTGQLSVGGIAQASSVEPTPDAYRMIFGRRAFLGYAVRSSGEAYWFANLQAPADDAKQSTAAWKARLLELFADDVGPAAALIAATSALAAWPIFDLPTVTTWHRDRLVLLGDAAHATSPSSGQGASLAMEDAVVLAQCLRDLPTHGQAFAAYERLRRPRVERVVRASARVSNSKVAGPIGRVVRDLLMPVALRFAANPANQAWLHGYHLEWDKSVLVSSETE